MPLVHWLPTDADPEALASIESWIAEAAIDRIEKPRVLDARSDDWEMPPVDAVFNANMIHISEWSVALGLLAGAGRVLRPGGLLFLYGPFKRAGEHTSQSNADFDASLRARDPSWGIRDLEKVVEEAARVGLEHVETNDLPANNKLLVFEKNQQER
jgi:SAM-dependent methyltransferase